MSTTDQPVMPKNIFITGSADGLGLMAAKLLVQQGHHVILHARNPQRADQALAACPGATAVLSADLSSISATKSLAAKVNDLVSKRSGSSGRLDAVIHNAGMGYQEPARGNTEDGLPVVFAVNSLAPYILTALIKKPHRLVYITSGLHTGGDPSLDDLTWTRKCWNGLQAYSDTKLHNVLLSNAVARRYKDQVVANAVSPGWVATKMGGSGAPDSLEEAPKTQCWLATGEDAGQVSGKLWYHGQEQRAHKAAAQVELQERYLALCKEISGVELQW